MISIAWTITQKCRNEPHVSVKDLCESEFVHPFVDQFFEFLDGRGRPDDSDDILTTEVQRIWK